MQKKALILGIDGVPYELLRGMIDKGVMPGLKKLLESGYGLHEMKASLPDISSVSWTSFMTGVNPGMHGIYGFTQLMPNSYNLFFPNSTNIKAPTFWQTLRDRGKVGKSAVLNLPNTYPAFPIDGLLVSGFVAIDFNKAVYPPRYIPPLKKMNYVIDVDLLKARSNKEGFHKDLVESLAVREKTALNLLKEDNWDIFLLCVTETDRLHHFFFEKSGTPLFESFYGNLDKLISSVYGAAKEKYGDDFLFLMLSDHGFVPLRKEVNLNACLQKAGLLKLDNSREFYDRIAQGTTAFAMDPGRIYIHRKGKFPRGHIKGDEERKARDSVKKLFVELADTDGSKPVKKIYEKEEIYSGPFFDEAPDLLVMANDEYDLKGNLRKNEVFSNDIFTGMHSWHNAIFVAPKETEVKSDFSIEHPARVIIDYFS